MGKAPLALFVTLLLVYSAASGVAAESTRAASRDAETLVPDTTVGFIAIPDMATLNERWGQTQLGQLVQDEAMRPFVEDIKRQFQDRLARQGVHLGIQIEDLKEIAGGEVGLAAIQPGRDPSKFAFAIIADIAEHEAKAREMLASVARKLVKDGATQSQENQGRDQVTVFTFPKKKNGSRAVQVLWVVHGNHLVACDSRDELRAIIGRLDGQKNKTLADHPAYQGVMSHLPSTSEAAQARWFVDPFGYATLVRAASAAKKPERDFLKILINQGFAAVQGIGGNVYLAGQGHDLMHRTFIYAPATQSGAEKYKLAARMLDLPNQSSLAPQAWIPRDIDAFVTLSWNMKSAFWKAESLVDEVAEDPGFFRSMINNMRTDEQGPMIDVEKDLVQHLGQRATIITDNRLPITTKSERFMVALELTRPDVVARTIAKVMSKDPDAKKRVFDGQVIWEIINDDTTVEVERLNIDGAGLGGGDEGTEEPSRPMLPNSAITVAQGHLIIASHVDYVVDVLKRVSQSGSLSSTPDFQRMTAELEKLDAASDSARFFARTDESYRPAYELVRQGKMPEAESLFGKLLNQMLGSNEDGSPRHQQIDGSKMPDFERVQRYLGPIGGFMRSEVDGWSITGCILPKVAE